MRDNVFNRRAWTVNSRPSGKYRRIVFHRQTDGTWLCYLPNMEIRMVCLCRSSSNSRAWSAKCRTSDNEVTVYGYSGQHCLNQLVLHGFITF